MTSPPATSRSTPVAPLATPQTVTHEGEVAHCFMDLFYMPTGDLVEYATHALCGWERHPQRLPERPGDQRCVVCLDLEDES